MSSSYDASDPIPVLPSAAPRKGMSGCVIAIIVGGVLGLLGMATCVGLGVYGAGKALEVLAAETAIATNVGNDFIAAMGRGDVARAHALCHGAITEAALAAFHKEHAAAFQGATGFTPAEVELPVLGKMRGEWRQFNNDTYVLLNPGPIVGGPAGEVTLYLHKGAATAGYRVFWCSLRANGLEQGVGDRSLAPRQ